MTFVKYQTCLKEISKIIKNRFPNLSVEEVITITSDIINKIIDVLEIKQE